MSLYQLGQTDLLVLLAITRLGEEAYGVLIRQEIRERTGHSVSIAAVYQCLRRLNRASFVTSWLSEPTARRGGRAKKHFRATKDGQAALASNRHAMDRMWEDRVPVLGG